MFIIRYSEIGLKGEKSRRQMENILIQNIKSELERYNIFPEFKKVTEEYIYLLILNYYTTYFQEFWNKIILTCRGI